MGSSQSCKHVEPLPVDLPRTNTIRSSIRSKLPMPEQTELERRFTKVLASMDLPPDKAKLLKQYDDEKKWGLICDQELVQAKDPPSHYLNKLRTYLDPKASRSYRKRKIVGDATSTQVLRDLEISLRTNHIEWVREFLNEENQGLNSLINYLSFRLQMMQCEQRLHDDTSRSAHASDERISNLIITPESPMTNVRGANQNSLSNGGLVRILATDNSADSEGVRRRHRHAAKLKMGDTNDDIHVCIMCLRAIMNNKYGFNMVIQHTEAINCIALSLMHKSLRTKALVLELLAAICLVKGGHEIILCAFDKFKDTCHESKRFQTLMDYFINYDNFHVEFMVACVQFVNIVVHSVEDMNYRVHLQYEFTALGLDAYLERLRRQTESEELRVQILAYLDNVFDVAALMEDSETKTAALEKVAEMEDELGQAHDRLSEIERESLAQLASLETALAQARADKDELLEGRRQIEEEVATLRRTVSDQRQQSQSRQSMLEETIQQLMSRGVGGGVGGANSGSGGGTLPLSTSTSAASSAVSMPPPPPPPAPPPAPPPPPSAAAVPPPPPPPPIAGGGGGAGSGFLSSAAPRPPPPLFGVPPPAGQMQAPDGAMTIKRKVLTKHKLPTLNWIPLKPNQVRGTIFNELDDDKLYSIIDFADFEEKFKLAGSVGGGGGGGRGGVMANGVGGRGADSDSTDGGGTLTSFPSKRFKKADAVSLLEHTRLRNIAISRRKIDMPVERVVVAINALDLKQISLENVEILQKMVPTDAEAKAYREYTSERKDVALLTEEDRFLLQLCRVERLANKLAIINYMGNFIDNLHLITPQVHAIISASGAVKSSQKLRRVLELVLAFGNYLNSCKRGPAYGFKLQSLDTLLDTKASDKRTCLLHYIVATIRDKFPDLLTFDAELIYIDKAATVSLENVLLDVTELEKTMEVVRKEADLRKETPSSSSSSPSILRDFLANSEDKLRRLRSDARAAADSFAECAELFGEPPRATDANAFFSLLVRFVRAFKAADVENEQRRRLEAAERLAAAARLDHVNGPAADKRNNNERTGNAAATQRRQQDAVISELKVKARQVHEKKLLPRDEVYNGALEDILLGLKSEPYRRADAVRRSQRRRIDSNRLSRTMDELEV